MPDAQTADAQTADAQTTDARSERPRTAAVARGDGGLGDGPAPEGILAAVFGHERFRGGQERAISAVLSGRDTLAVMPTGGGKSLCYQIPALMKGPGEGITLVVCPLVSLMKDQVESLRRRLDDPGAVAALHSKVPAGERREIERRALSGALRVLFVAPERLRSLEFCVFLKRAAGGGASRSSSWTRPTASRSGATPSGPSTSSWARLSPTLPPGGPRPPTYPRESRCSPSPPRLTRGYERT